MPVPTVALAQKLGFSEEDWSEAIALFPTDVLGNPPNIVYLAATLSNALQRVVSDVPAESLPDEVRWTLFRTLAMDAAYHASRALVDPQPHPRTFGGAGNQSRMYDR